MITDKNEYDLIVSLGGNCAAALQLKRRNLRLFSFPFDYLAMQDGRGVNYLAEGFLTDFSNFMLKNNLKELNDEEKKKWAKT